MEDYNDWVTFYDTYAADFHPTFKKELSEQLLDKISALTGHKNFCKYGFLLLIGLDDLHERIIDNKMYAYIKIITPVSISINAWIYWYCNSCQDLRELHKRDITGMDVVFEWNSDFPLEEVASYLRPRKREKKEKTGLKFNLEYYYYSLPDITVELYFSQQLSREEMKEINIFIYNFYKEWNSRYAHKAINYISELGIIDDNTCFFIADVGLKNNISVINNLLKLYSSDFDGVLPVRVCLK